MANSQQINPNTSVNQTQYHCNVCTFKAYDKTKLKLHTNKHVYLKSVCADYKRLESGKRQCDDAYFCTTCNLSFSKKSLIAYHNKYQCKNVIDMQESAQVIEKSTNVNADSQPEECSVVSEDDNSDCSEDYYDSSYISTSTRKKKKVDPILIVNPKSTVSKLRSSHVHKLSELANLNGENVPDDVRVLNIATAQIIDRTIKCFRCNIFFKTHKDLKAHLDKWHSDELMQLSNQFTNDINTVQHRCTGCSLTFANVRSVTKHYYKDCVGNIDKLASEVHESHQEKEQVLEDIASEMVINDGFETSNDASDAELLTYLQNAAHNSQISSHQTYHVTVEDHLVKIASVQANDRAIKCIRCSIPFASHKELNLHLAEVHGKELEELSNQFESKKGKSIKIQHKCSKCTFVFPSVRLLTKHYKECKAPKQTFLATPCNEITYKPRRSPRKKHITE